MTIAIASDHGGFEMKKALIEYFAARGQILKDLGTFSAESVDYPDYAAKMAQEIYHNKVETGILICGTGIGISIAANRYKGIRAALLYSDQVAALARQHNNANVIVFGGRTMTPQEAIHRTEIFLNASYEGERHQRRLNKLEHLCPQEKK